MRCYKIVPLEIDSEKGKQRKYSKNILLSVLTSSESRNIIAPDRGPGGVSSLEAQSFHVPKTFLTFLSLRFLPSQT